MTDMKRFNSHKQRVTAKPMTRQAYNDLRGWELPVDECGADDGYLVVDISADSNFDGYDGHVSWKPKALFENQYYEVDAALFADVDDSVAYDDSDDDAQYADETSVCGYGVNGSTRQGLSLDQELMRETIALISPKYADSRTDHMLDDANKIVSAIMGRDSQACDAPDENKTHAERISKLLGVQVSNVVVHQEQGDVTCTNVAGVNIADSFDFGLAIHCLKNGKKVARAGWNGKGMFIYYVPAASYPMQRNNLKTMGGIFPDDMVPYRDYLALKTAQNDVATWTPSVSDALATDWQLV